MLHFLWGTSSDLLGRMRANLVQVIRPQKIVCTNQNTNHSNYQAHSFTLKYHTKNVVTRLTRLRYDSRSPVW